MTDFLPMDAGELRRLGWTELDILLVTGDAYVDHPSFGAGLLGRWLVSQGYRVGIVAQPRWTSVEDISRMGAPRLFVGITAGNLDSMLAHYTAFRKKRRDDAYTAGGLAGARPNRAVFAYSALARQAFPGAVVVLGGVEASMRRASHYDFWSDSLRRSALLDSKADLLVYGMAETAITEISGRLREACETGSDLRTVVREGLLRGIPGTAYSLGQREARDFVVPDNACRLPSHEEMEADPARLLEATLMIERQVHQAHYPAIQFSGQQAVVFTPPPPPLSTDDMDALYGLDFNRRQHPGYSEAVPGLETVRFSVTTHRGCAGGCSFCSLAAHQGRRIASRSPASVLSEVKRLTAHPEWKGSISDIGGPSANMWECVCTGDQGKCTRASCLVPEICSSLKPAQADLANLLDAIAGVEGVRHVRVASGIRYDLAAREPVYLEKLIGRFVGGQLKVAPEHCCDSVLKLMRKPPFRAFEQFMQTFERVSRRAGKEQYVVPYLISAFPGTTDADMRVLRDWLDQCGWEPQQVQCFIPLPGTVAAAMYFAGVGPGGERIQVARTDAERLRQHGILAKS